MAVEAVFDWLYAHFWEVGGSVCIYLAVSLCLRLHFFFRIEAETAFSRIWRKIDNLSFFTIGVPYLLVILIPFYRVHQSYFDSRWEIDEIDFVLGSMIAYIALGVAIPVVTKVFWKK